MQKWTGKRLSKSQIAKILKEIQYTDVTSKYKKELPLEMFFLLKDGRFIIRSLDGAGAIYPTEGDFLALMTGKSTTQSIPYPQNNFLDSIDSEIDKLSKLTNVKLGRDDKFDALRSIDEVFRIRGWNDLDMQKYVIPLTAFCGQVVINESGGHWVKDGSDYNVQLTSGEIIMVSHLVRKDFVNTPSNISFTGVFYEELHHIVQQMLEGKEKR